MRSPPPLAPICAKEPKQKRKRKRKERRTRKGCKPPGIPSVILICNATGMSHGRGLAAAGILPCKGRHSCYRISHPAPPTLPLPTRPSICAARTRGAMRKTRHVRGTARFAGPRGSNAYRAIRHRSFISSSPRIGRRRHLAKSTVGNRSSKPRKAPSASGRCTDALSSTGAAFKPTRPGASCRLLIHTLLLAALSPNQRQMQKDEPCRRITLQGLSALVDIKIYIYVPLHGMPCCRHAIYEYYVPIRPHGRQTQQRRPHGSPW